MASVNSWFTEMKRRRVFRALIGYGIAAFAVLQIIEPIMHGLHWPETVLSYVVAALAAGFPVVISLAWIFDVKAGRIERTAPAPAATGLTGVRLALLLVGIGILAAAPGLVWYFFVRGIARPATVPATPTEVATPSIAVLPFADMSAGKDQEYFSDGIAEEILNALAQVKGLQVTGRTSSFSFKGKNDDLRSIGQKLNVAYVLEGSVRRESDHVRITAQLINARDGYHLWSEVYDRELKNIFAVEEELARSIVRALRPRLVDGKAEPIIRQTTTNLTAHELYLKGRYFWSKRNAEGLTKAAAYFQQAIELDPAYALAYAGLAESRALLIEYGSAPSQETVPKAKEAALKALQLDDTLAEPHASLGLISSYELDWATMERELRRAIQLKPDYPTAHQWYAVMLNVNARCTEARAEGERAAQLDPTSPVISNIMTAAFYCARDYDRAIEHARKTLELDPHFSLGRSYLALAYIGKGRTAEAVQELEKAERSNRYDADLGYAYALAGQREKALRLLADIEARSRSEYVPGTVRALIYLGLGEKEQALLWLEKALAEQDWRLRMLKSDPRFDPLRSEARFARILRQVHLD